MGSCRNALPAAARLLSPSPGFAPAHGPGSCAMTGPEPAPQNHCPAGWSAVGAGRRRSPARALPQPACPHPAAPLPLSYPHAGQQQERGGRAAGSGGHSAGAAGARRLCDGGGQRGQVGIHPSPGQVRTLRLSYFSAQGVVFCSVGKSALIRALVRCAHCCM